MSKLVDTDGENLALRTFLLHYQNPGVTITAMRNALRRLGFDGCWPAFVDNAAEFSTLTKGGAQVWIRHLISLEPKPEVKPVAITTKQSIKAMQDQEFQRYLCGRDPRFVLFPREDDVPLFMHPSEKASYIIIDKDYCVFKTFELTDAIHEALEKKLVSVLRLGDLTGIAIDGTWEDIQDWRDEFVAQMEVAK